MTCQNKHGVIVGIMQNTLQMRLEVINQQKWLSKEQLIKRNEDEVNCSFGTLQGILNFCLPTCS